MYSSDSGSSIIDFYADAMANHKACENDEEFADLLVGAGGKLVVADFSATWCGPCQQMHPVFIQMAHKYPNALFLGVDVDDCRETAVEQGVSAMPTFIFYKNRKQIDAMQGAHAQLLEEKIRLHYDAAGQETSGHAHAQAHAHAGASGGGPADVSPYMDHKRSACLNEDPATPFQAFLDGKTAIKSFADQQLILTYAFKEPLKLHSIKVKTAGTNGPKVIRLYVNQPKFLDFNTVASVNPAQEIKFLPKDVAGAKHAHAVDLHGLKFMSVRTLQIFVVANQGDSDVTQIDSLILFGAPASATNSLS